jgi:peptidoglycan-N-acetylglucosamine deacetylase
MLNYRNTVISFTILLVALILADLLSGISHLWYLGLAIVFIALLTWGSVHLRLGFYIRSYCAGSRDQLQVAFTFDDGPDISQTPLILDMLKDEQITAAFFVVGKKIESHHDLVRRIGQEGHILGGHSYSHHFFFDLFSVRRMKIEMEKTTALIELTTGKRTNLFRPPYGVTNPTVAALIRKLNYLSIGWSLKSRDTVITDPDVLLERLKRKVKPGDLVLFHDTRSVVPQVLPLFITYLKNKQYQIVRPDQLLNIKVYE